MPKTIAILSPGEMGHAIGGVLGRRGLRVVTCLAGRSERTRGLTDAAGIEDCGSLDILVREADVVLSVTTSAAASGVGDDVARRLAGRNRPLTFVECNAMAPQHVRPICDRVAAAGGLVVDVGIVGGPPTDTKSPKFYASGRDAGQIGFLNDHGLDVRPIGPEIGQASGLKMCYAALTKGLSAMGSELLMVAEKLDLLDPLLSELADSQAAQLKWLEGTVPGMPPKSRRWVSEMQEIAATFEHLGQSPGYHRAASAFFERVGETRLGHERPESRDTSRTVRGVVEELAEALPKPLVGVPH